MRANEQSIRSALQAVAVFASMTTSPANPNGTMLVSALNQRVANTLTPTGSKQSLADIATDLASAQVAMKDISARQDQSQVMLQSLVDRSEIHLQRSGCDRASGAADQIQASYQTTAMLSQLSLIKYLPV